MATTQGTPPRAVVPTAVAGRGSHATGGGSATAVAPQAIAGTPASVTKRGVIAGPVPGAVPGVRTKTGIGTPAVAVVLDPRAGVGAHIKPGTYGTVQPRALAGIPQAVIPDSVFLAAEARNERWPFGVVKVDWTEQDFTGPGADMSKVVTSIEVERSRVGELPETSGLVDGYDSGHATVQLQGTRPGSALTVAAELSPYRTDRPRYGEDDVTAPVIIDMGLITEDGPKAYRQMTGPLRTVSVNESTERAALKVVDPNENIRELVTLPTYGEFASHANRRPWALTVNTQGVVDWVCRENDLAASPPHRPDAIVSCTGHGWLVAEVGYNDAPISINVSNPPQAGLWTDDDHPWGMLGTPEPADKNGTLGYQQFYGITNGIDAPVRFQSGYGVALSGWLHAGSWMQGNSTSENRIWHIRPTVNDYPRLFVNGFPNGELYAGISIDANTIISTPRFRPGPAKWHHLGLHWRWTSNTRCELRVRLDGAVTTYTLDHAAIVVTPTPFYDGYKATTELRGHLFRSWTNLQMWVGYTPPTVAEWQALESWTSRSTIGRGINELLYLPDVAAKDSWAILKAVVAAEFGVHGFDPAGRYFFRPRSDAYAGSPTVEIDVETNLSEVAYSISSDSVRNVVGYSVTPKYHATDGKGPRSETVVVKAQDPYQFTVPAGKRYTYEVDWPWGATGWRGGVLPYHAQKGSNADNGSWAVWGPDVVHGWTYSTKGASGNWTIVDNVQSVVVRYVQTGARRALVVVDNTDPSCTKDIRLATAMPADASSDGEPALRIGGWPLVDMPAHVASFRNQDSIDRHRGQARGYDIPTSEWRQTPGVLDPVCDALLKAMADAIPVLEDLPVRGNPKVQVGDLARCTFRGPAVQPVVGTIVKVNRKLDAGGVVDKVSVRPLPQQTLAPAGWTFFIDVSRYQGDRADPIDLARVAQLGYGGCIAKIGQGAGVTMTGVTYGQSLDAWWVAFRDQSKQLWPTTTAGYWYVGNTETPASQASRCKAAIGDLNLPVMLDWEDGGGDFANLTAVLAAFRSAGLRVTMLYAGSGYVSNTKAADPTATPPTGAGGGNPSNIDAATGLKVIRARYWTNDQDHPRALFDDITNPAGFGLAPFNGATPDAFQFTQYGVVYPGMAIDVDAAPVSTVQQLSNIFYNRA